jgi:uncharacterized phage protein (TIGR02218 family)
LSSPVYRGAGAIVAVSSARRITASGLDAYASDWFTHGLVTFTSGAASGQKVEVKRHTFVGGIVTLELWQPAREPLTSGQTFTVTAGCDKHLGTCIAKFSNAANFRGFPHMPGNDFLTRIARPGASSS